jgi:hypothetical protein
MNLRTYLVGAKTHNKVRNSLKSHYYVMDLALKFNGFLQRKGGLYRKHINKFIHKWG